MNASGHGGRAGTSAHIPCSACQLTLQAVRKEWADLKDVARQMATTYRQYRPVSDHGTNSTFARLNAVRWTAATYVLSGGRTLRPPRFANHHRGATGLQGCRALRLDAVADVVDLRAVRLARRIQNTDDTVTEWLVAHRDTVASGHPRTFGRRPRSAIAVPAMSTDPLYSLVCHIGVVLDTVDCTSDDADGVLLHLEAMLTRPLAVVHDEMAAMRAYTSALAALVASIPP